MAVAHRRRQALRIWRLRVRAPEGRPPWTVWRFPDILLKLADAERRSSHYVEAELHYQELLELSKPSTEYVRVLGTFASYDVEKLDAIRAHATSALDTLLRNHVAQLVIDAPAGAAVRIDGSRTSPSDAPILLTPGEHAVVISLRGKDIRRTVSCNAGELHRVTVGALGHAK